MNTNYSIEQFEDKPLAHYSYAILSEGEIILIDPARNPQPYYDFAKKHHAKIVGVIETHPHADFVSSHLEISQSTGATLYVSKLVDAAYPHQSFDDRDSILLGNLKLKAVNTPGHSPDSICIILENEQKDIAVFTGDTLFIGDCGRPDLRENAGNITATRANLAKNMYYSLREKLMPLANDVSVYPAHGAGTLCGKGLSEANSSTIGAEKKTNWSLQALAEQDFVSKLIEDQPFIPKYFGHDVALNRKGAESFSSNLEKINFLQATTTDAILELLDPEFAIVDTRPESTFKQGHLPNAINLQIGGKFETWLGSIISPNEPFYLLASSSEQLEELIERIAKIGYETQIKAAFAGDFGSAQENTLDLDHFITHPQAYTIIDIRNASEANENQIFTNTINIPLPELRERIGEIAHEKPIMIHCAGGYRSAAGSSIVKNSFKDIPVYDLSEAISSF